MSALAVGDAVVVGKVQERGTVRFIGETQFQAGEWVGVELETPAGKNDGSVLGIRYFDCPAARGIFVRPSAVTKVEPGSDPASPSSAPPPALSIDTSAAPTAPPPAPSPKATSKRSSTAEGGSSKRGSVDPAKSKEAKEKASAQAAEAAAKASAKPAPPQASGRESVVGSKTGAPRPAPAADKPAAEAAAPPPAAPAPAAKEAEPPADVTDSLPAFQESQRVCLFNQHGTIRFVGATKFADGIWVGIELDQAIGKCDGSVKGVQYFRCNPNHGIFLQAPTVDPEAVKQTSKDAKPVYQRRNSNMSARGQQQRSRVSTSASADDEVIVAEDSPHFTIMDADGQPMDIEDLIQAFEECREELEGVQELLEEAHERERELRFELQSLREGSQPTDGAPLILPPGGVPETVDGEGSPSRRSKPALPRGVRKPHTDLKNKAEEIKHLLGDLHKTAERLKHIQAKRDGGDLAPADVEWMAKIYTACNGDLDKIAKECGLDVEVLRKKPPVNATEFARKLLNGIYTGDTTHDAIESLRGRLKDDLQAKQSKLKRTTTKELNGEPSMDEVDMVAILYTRFNGDLAQIAAQCGISEELLKKHTPEDAKDFGRKLLKGVYCEDRSESAKAALRDRLGSELKKQASMLRRTNTKEYSGELREEDIEYIAKIYRENRGDLNRLAKTFGASVSLVKKHGAKDETDFARKLLEGMYTGDEGAIAKQELRDRLREDLQSQAGKLRRTATKEYSGPSEVEVAAVAKFYSSNNGDLAKIAQACGISLDLLQKSAPENEREFALKLLEGCYSADSTDAAKAALRNRLADQILARKNTLRRTETKSAAGLTAVELEFVGKIYTANNGDLKKVAIACGLNVELLTNSPPTDAQDFARKLYDGVYTADQTEQAKASLRERLREDLLGQIGKLKPAVVKEANKVTSRPEVDRIAKVWAQHRGKVDMLVAQFGVNPTTYSKSPPKDGEEFAKRLLDGYYTGDTSEIAKATLRERLRDDLQAMATTLKPTQVKEKAAGPISADVEQFAAVYTKLKGDINELAKMFALDTDLLNSKKPTSAEDFATKLLDGAYTGETSELAKTFLRKRLRNDLQEQAGKLKRQTTKENMLEPPTEELELLSQVYTKNNGDLEKLAQLISCPVELLQKNPPQDAMDFARKLFNGSYTQEKSEAAKADLRKRLEQELRRQASQLKRTSTKEWNGESLPEDIAALEKVFTACRGNLEKLANVCGANLALMKMDPPKDGEDFGRKLLEGSYTGDTTMVARKQLRQRLQEDLQRQSSVLRRTSTKEFSGTASEDIEAMVWIWDTHHGDFDRIAEACGFPVALLHKRPAKDAREFARFLLEGAYAHDVEATAKANMRKTLNNDLQVQAGKLKRQVTKESVAEPSGDDLEKLAQVYTKNNGDLDKLAQLIKCPVEVLVKSAPKDAQDFARKLLNGTYTVDKSETAKVALRKRLEADLGRQASQLKRTNTKELSGDALPEDIAALAKVYTQCRGDLDKLANLCGANVGLLKGTPPKDGEDFAKRLLEGFYTGDTTMMARKQLRDKLAEDLQRQSSILRRTTTKEFSGTSNDDIEAMVWIWDAHHGDFKAIAEACGFPASVLEKKPPRSGREFAKNLLEGAYAYDKDAGAKATLREQLKEGGLQEQAGKLKRQITKEAMIEPEPEDIEVLAHVYRAHDGDLHKLAELLNTPVEVLEKNPPKDAVDFAKKLFAGVYAADKMEIAKVDLRQRLENDLKRQGSQLKRTTTKELTGEAQAEDIAALAKVFTACRGDLAKLANVCGINLGLLKSSPPTDGEDFGKRLLEGAFTGDTTLIARKQLRDRLAQDLQRQSSTLRRTTTKTFEGVADEDVEALSWILDKYSGDFDAIAEACGFPVALLHKTPPANAREFAKNLLEGAYSTDMETASKAAKRLRAELQEQAGKLKKQTTKELSGEANPEDIAALAKVFGACNGDIEKLATLCTINLALIKGNPPKDGEDFAKKLLEGAYTGDSTLIARKQLRDRLAEDLPKKFATLRRTSTKLFVGPADEDIQAMVWIWDTHHGDFEAIAEACGFPVALLHKRPPKDAQDFAKNLLEGVYAQDREGSAKASKRFRDDLQDKSSKLRRQVTKENVTEPAASELDVIAQVYAKNNGDLEKLAQLINSPVEVLQRNPPSDGRDFARKLFNGTYSGSIGERAKIELMKRLEVELRRQMSTLKRTNTKEFTGEARPEDIAALCKVYAACEGDLEKLATACGANLSLMQASPPKDAEEWGKKLLEGAYTGDDSLIARKQLRDRLAQDLQRQFSVLRRTTTKEFSGPTEQDIEAVIWIWETYHGDYDQIAEACGFSVEILQKRPPADGRAFAKALLDGTYAEDRNEAAKAKLRDGLAEDLQDQSSKLKRQTTKENVLEPTAAELDFLAEVFTKNGGDLDKLAQLIQSPTELLHSNPPQDAVDFARKLFDGQYTSDKSERAKAELREKLAEELRRQASMLKRTSTKEYTGEIAPEDVAALSKVFDACAGDLEKLATTCGASLALLQGSPPKDAEDFARKLLEGAYTGDSTLIARKQLRDRLAQDLQRQSSMLKRAATKEFAGVSNEDIEALTSIWDDHHGDFQAISEAIGVPVELLQKRPPANAREFAKNLLEGAYAHDR